MMSEDDTIRALGEGEAGDWEFESAQGGLPHSVWETYSATANTDGGPIVLGVEPDGPPHAVTGLKNPAAVQKQFWDLVNNRGKVSANLLAPDAVAVRAVAGRPVLVARVPRAARRPRPVYVGQNPLTNTYRRNYEGDDLCRPEEVGRMLADQSEESADARVLPHFGAADLDADSVRQYRNRFSARNPTHAWLAEDTVGFLRRLGGWRRNRESGEEGPTVAGLLMFGGEDALADPTTGPKPHLDYRERVSDAIADRWHDRLTVDGTWVPNLFQFFQRVFPRLTSGLKLPFAYHTSTTTLPPFADPIRAGLSPAHEAVQEALVNALIHADYRGQGGVVIDRFPDRIEMCSSLGSNSDWLG